jgi:hypothetical protein
MNSPLSDDEIKRRKEIDEVIAQALFDGLQRGGNWSALVSGDPLAPLRQNSVIVDGSFNLRVVARHIRRSLEKLHSQET